MLQDFVKMSTGMPELGSKISLISKADIRYEGRLFTVDPQECTIALSSGKWKKGCTCAALGFSVWICRMNRTIVVST